MALTCRRFGGASIVVHSEVGSSISLIEETARRIVHDVANEEQRNALPRYDGENWLSKYNHLQILQMPLTFDQLVGTLDYLRGGEQIMYC